jgi:hypothetical protein
MAEQREAIDALWRQRDGLMRRTGWADAPGADDAGRIPAADPLTGASQRILESASSALLARLYPGTGSVTAP